MYAGTSWRCRILFDGQNLITGVHQPNTHRACNWALPPAFKATNDSLKKTLTRGKTLQRSFTATVHLLPSLTSPRIKLHLLQVLHHGGKRSDVSEDYTKEWVTHLFWPLSTAVPPHSPTPSFLYPFSFSISCLSACNLSVTPPLSILLSVLLTPSSAIPLTFCLLCHPSLPRCLSSPPRCTLSAWPLSAVQVFEIYSAYTAFKCLWAAA